MSIITTLFYITQHVSIYFGIPLLIAGLFGGLLNVIVFLSLRTFRQSSCAFYLTIISFVNLGQLLTGLFSRIMINGFYIDWTHKSISYCKIRYFALQSCSLISCTCICLAILDQYFATCTRPRWQRWSHLRVAYCLTSLFSFIWILHGILYLIFVVQVKSSMTGEIVCTIVDRVFSRYHPYGYLITLTSVLPVAITVFFGLLVYNHVRQIAYRTVPLVRRELDKQLTNMVLKQVIINFFTVLPYAIMGIILLNVTNKTDQVTIAVLQFIQTMTIYLYYLNYAVRVNPMCSITMKLRRSYAVTAITL